MLQAGVKSGQKNEAVSRWTKSTRPIAFDAARRQKCSDIVNGKQKRYAKYHKREHSNIYNSIEGSAG